MPVRDVKSAALDFSSVPRSIGGVDIAVWWRRSVRRSRDSAAARRAAPATAVAWDLRARGSVSWSAATARASAARARPCRVFATESCISRARRARSDSTASATASRELASARAWLAVPKWNIRLRRVTPTMPAAMQKPATRRVLAPAARTVFPGSEHREQHDELEPREDSGAAPAVQQARQERGADGRVREGRGGGRGQQEYRAEDQVHRHEGGVGQEAGAKRSQSLSMAYEPMTPRTAAARTP